MTFHRTAPQNEVRPPVGATYVDSWDWEEPNDEIRNRFFYGTRRGDTGAHRVEIVGTQAGDGTVAKRLIAVGLGRDSIYFASRHAAREAAADMLAAADDWEAALVGNRAARLWARVRVPAFCPRAAQRGRNMYACLL